MQSSMVKKMLLFARFDFLGGEFDVSSAQRIYEATQVLSTIDSGGSASFFFGNGFGANVDLSLTNDSAISSSQVVVERVRNIHFLFFSLLLKYGALGLLLIYFGLIVFIVKIHTKLRSRYENNSMKLVFKVLALYSIIIIIDGQISAGHLLSNPFFCFSLILSWRIANEFKNITVGHNALNSVNG